MRVAAWAAIPAGLNAVMPAAVEPCDTTTSKAFLTQLAILREGRRLNQPWLREESTAATGHRDSAADPMRRTPSRQPSWRLTAGIFCETRRSPATDARVRPVSGLYHRERAMLRLERYRMQPFPNELDDLRDSAA